MDKHLQAFLERFGAATQQQDASVETIERYRDKLPPKLLEYWRLLGFSGFMNGLFWITDPAEFDDDMELWIGDTPLVEEDAYHVIGRSGFGDLFLWGEKNGFKYLVNAAHGWILQEDGDRAEIAARGSEAALKRFFAVLTPDYCDVTGVDKQPLFERAVSRLGPLAQHEVFAFEPALLAGGKPALGTLAKRDVHVHHAVLAQFGHREVLDHDALAKRAFG